MSGDRIRVFLSYAHEDRLQAHAVARQTEEEWGHEVIGDFDIRPGERWRDEIHEGIRAADALVVLLSAHSVDSPWVFGETLLARHEGIPVLPVRLENIDPPDFLAHDQWVDLFENIEAGWLELRQGYNHVSGRGPGPGPAPDPAPELTTVVLAGAGRGKGVAIPPTGIHARDARLHPFSIAFDSDKMLYIACFNGGVHKVDDQGRLVQVWDAPFQKPSIALGTGIGQFEDPVLYLADGWRGVYRFGLREGVADRIAGTDEAGFSDDGASAIDTRLNAPLGIESVGSNVYVADTGNQRVRVIDADGNIRTVAGNGTCGSAGDHGPAVLAQLNEPRGLAFDASANALLICDMNNHKIRRVRLSDGEISTFAGTGVDGFSGDGGAATDARLSTPSAVAVVGDDVLIADFGNRRVRRVDRTGTITTVAGNGKCEFLGDHRDARDAEMMPVDLASFTWADQRSVGIPTFFFVADLSQRVVRWVGPEAPAYSLMRDGHL